MLPLPVVHTVGTCLSVANLIQALVTHSPGLHHVQDRSWIEDHRAQHGQGKGPAHVVVLPMRHPVTTIASCSENDHRDQTTGGGEEEQRGLGEQEHDIQVIVPGHEQEDAHEEASDEAQGEADGEQELHGHEEGREQQIVDHGVFVVKDPSTPVKGLVVEVVGLNEIVEAHLPESWNGDR